MKFEFDEDQEAVRSEVRRYLTKECTSRIVRGVLESDLHYDERLWRAMGEMGWIAAALPQEYGGQDAGYLVLCVIAEEIGRALAPVPFSSSVYLGIETLLLAGDSAQKVAWLPKLATGEAIGVLALAEGPGTTSWNQCYCTAHPATEEQFLITGVKWPVADGMAADVMMVLAQGTDGASLYIVEAGQPGVTRSMEPSLDESRPQARVEFKNAIGHRLGNSDVFTLQWVLNRAAVLYAFEQLGGADACLNMAVDYAKQRFAFGRPIGSFQAIKHKLADLYAELELARSNCYLAAWALSTDDVSLPEAAACARISVSRAYFNCAKECVQIHGGSGFTWELDPHLFYRRSQVLSALIGGQTRWREILVSELEKKHATNVALTCPLEKDEAL